MKKIAFLFMLAVIFLCAACSSVNPVSESEVYSLTHDIFHHQYSVLLAELSDISVLCADAQTQTEMVYTQGRIDGFLRHGLYEFAFIQNRERKATHPVIDPSLQEPVFSLTKEIGDYLKTLRRLTDQANAREIFHTHKEELRNIASQAKEINIHNPGKEHGEAYRKQIFELTEMLRKVSAWK